MNDLNFYEQILVLHPDTQEEDHKELCQLVTGLIEKDKGEIFRVDTWGSRPIANPKAKKATRAYYFHLLFSAPPITISAIRKQLSINRKVLYFHEERLSKRETPESHIEKYFGCLEESNQKEQERQARIQKRQTFRS